MTAQPGFNKFLQDLVKRQGQERQKLATSSTISRAAPGVDALATPPPPAAAPTPTPAAPPIDPRAAADAQGLAFDELSGQAVPSIAPPPVDIAPPPLPQDIKQQAAQIREQSVDLAAEAENLEVQAATQESEAQQGQLLQGAQQLQEQLGGPGGVREAVTSTVSDAIGEKVAPEEIQGALPVMQQLLADLDESRAGIKSDLTKRLEAGKTKDLSKAEKVAIGLMLILPAIAGGLIGGRRGLGAGLQATGQGILALQQQQAGQGAAGRKEISGLRKELLATDVQRLNVAKELEAADEEKEEDLEDPIIGTGFKLQKGQTIATKDVEILRNFTEQSSTLKSDVAEVKKLLDEAGLERFLPGTRSGKLINAKAIDLQRVVQKLLDSGVITPGELPRIEGRAINPSKLSELVTSKATSKAVLDTLPTMLDRIMRNFAKSRGLVKREGAAKEEAGDDLENLSDEELRKIIGSE